MIDLKKVDRSVTLDPISGIAGILDIVSYICSDMRNYYIQERRYVGIVKSYMNSINTALNKINDKMSEVELDAAPRVLNLLKKDLIFEFKKLKKRRLSSGDCCIVLVKKLLELILTKDYDLGNYKKETRTIYKIVTKLFDNVRNRSKNDSISKLNQSTRTLLDEGLYSKYSSSNLSFEDNDKFETNICNTSEIIFKDENQGKIVEVNWVRKFKS